MAKGARKNFLNQASSEQQQAQGYTQAANAAGTQALNAEMPTVMSYLQPGGNPAVTAATMGALGSQFGAQQQNALDTAARTGNAASTNATLQSLGRSQGAAAAQAAANNIAGQQKTALSTLSQLYGIDEDTMAKMMGLQISATGAYGSQANSPWLTSILPQVLKGAAQGATGGAAGAAAG